MGFLKYCRADRREKQLTIHFLQASINPTPGDLHWELLYLIDRFHPTSVTVDFSEVTYFSADAINDLLRARKHLQSSGGVMRLIQVPPAVYAKLKTLRLVGHVFQVEPACASRPAPAGEADTAFAGRAAVRS